jgi:ribosomal protein S18 acetylase RimI-like enzyme
MNCMSSGNTGGKELAAALWNSSSSARELGVQALHLEVDPGNDPALELYRRTGYEDHRRHLMTKRLVSPSRMQR